MLFCVHSSCQECLANLVATENIHHCPVCRVVIAPTNTLKVNVTLNYLTSNLDVMCTNVGCQWSGKYDMAEDHSSHCPRVKVKCENDGCHYVDTREANAVSCFVLRQAEDSVPKLWNKHGKGTFG